jgi:hypothetical protein
MSQPTGSNGSAEQASAVLAELVDQLTARIQAGETIDWQEVARRHPEHVEELWQLWPALGALQELSLSGEPLVVGAVAAADRPGVSQGRLIPVHRPTLVQRFLRWLRRRFGGAPAMFAALVLDTLPQVRIPG